MSLSKKRARACSRYGWLALGLFGLLLAGCSAGREGAGLEAGRQSRGALQARELAMAILNASPLADSSDVAARDAAGERLSRIIGATPAARGRVLWGGFDPARQFDLESCTLTRFVPLVWARIYLSAFMFYGTPTVSRHGPYWVAELPAKFRAGLPPGDYAYPLWHSKAKWEAHVNIQSILFLFDHGRLVAALRKSGTGAVEPRPWDGNWHWVDGQGGEQPRVALFSYLFSPENPVVPRLESSYRELAAEFREQECVGCHAPDNRARASRLLLLNFPNQALSSRDDLVDILRQNAMPPADTAHDRGRGISDRAVRQKLLHLAEDFAARADSALAIEKSLLAR